MVFVIRSAFPEAEFPWWVWLVVVGEGAPQVLGFFVKLHRVWRERERAS